MRRRGQAVHSDIDYSDKVGGQTVALLLSLGQNFFSLFFFFLFFAIFITVPEKKAENSLESGGRKLQGILGRE